TAVRSRRVACARSLLGVLLVAIAFGFLGAGWSGLRAARLAASPLRALMGRPVVLTGSTSADPSMSGAGWSVPVRVDVLWPPPDAGLQELRVHDAVWVEERGPPPGLVTGDRVEVTGSVRAAIGPFGDYLRHRGFAAILAAEPVTT